LRYLLNVCLFTVLGIPALTTAAQTAESIVRKMIDADSAALDGVETVTISKSLMGHTTTEQFEKVEVTTSDGNSMAALRPVSCLLQGSGQGGPGDLTPEQMRTAAGALDQQSGPVGKAWENELQKGGMPSGLQRMIRPPADQPWLSPNPGDMMGMYAGFLRAGAKGKEEIASQQSDAAVVAPIDDMTEFARATELVGREKIDGRQAFHLRAEGLDHTQRVEGDEFTLQTMDMWVDAERYVPLQMHMKGVATSRGETRPITIERMDQDYREVADSKMYEPYRQVTRIGGVMNAQQQAEIQKAQREMANMDKQLQSLPESQRQMIMRQMGPQLEMIKKMASSGAMEIVTEVREIQVNSDTPCQLTPGR